MNIEKHKFKGVFSTRKGKKEVILTKSLVPGQVVYGESIYSRGTEEYREWNPMRSKLGAGIMKKVSELGFGPGSKVLYLGASTGTTPSHVSDVIGLGGFLYAIDFAPRTTRELMFLSETRKNMMPIMADARHPETYSIYITKVDMVFQDVAQRDQAEIFLKNCNYYLKSGGIGVLAVKARSVDISRRPKEIFKEVKEKLEKEMKIIDQKDLGPFEKDHCLFVCRKK